MAEGKRKTGAGRPPDRQCPRGRGRHLDDSPAPLGSRQQGDSPATHAEHDAPESHEPSAATARPSCRAGASPLRASQAPSSSVPNVGPSSSAPCPLLDGVRFYALDSKQEDVLWQASILREDVKIAPILRTHIRTHMGTYHIDGLSWPKVTKKKLLLLSQVQPSCIVLYEPDLAFIRQVMG